MTAPSPSSRARATSTPSASSTCWRSPTSRRPPTCCGPVYDATDGVDGYISLEVSPYLSDATDETIAEARRLWKAVDKPNLMVKVPGTAAGVPAIRTLIGDGININVTLLFSQEAYAAVAEAYLDGLEAFKAKGGDVSRVASVASFFISPHR